MDKKELSSEQLRERKEGKTYEEKKFIHVFVIFPLHSKTQFKSDRIRQKRCTEDIQLAVVE